MANTRSLLITVAIVIALMGINVIATYQFLTAPHPGMNDYLTTWEGARSYWIDRVSPYSDQASRNIQTMIYGRPAIGDEFPNHFAYPFHLVLVLAPLVVFLYAWASAIWLVLMEAALIGALILLLDLMRWRVRPLMLLVLILFTLFFYPAARGLLLGQVSHAVFFLHILAFWLLARGRDGWAGAILAIATFKPQLSVLVIPLLMLWGLRERRWRLILTFGLTGLAILILTLIAQPDWLSGWLYQLRLYPTYTDIASPLNTIALTFGWGAWFEVIGTVMLGGGWLWAGYRLIIGQKRESFWWVIALTTVITHLILFRTATPHYVYFLFPILFTFHILQRRDRRRGLWLILGSIALLIVLPWLHFAQTVQGSVESAAVYVPLPFVTLALLIFTRRWWETDSKLRDPYQHEEAHVAA